MALAGQAKSLDDGFALASTAGEIETVISPMQEGGGTSHATRVPGSGRGTDEIEAHPRADSTAAHAAHPASVPTSDSANPHVHKGHGRAWQSLLPGAMK
jgi:imidazolonepropionase-like amidohydrolase